MKRVLYNLNRHKNQAAAYLERHGYRGRRKDAGDCVIHAYLSRQLPGIDAQVCQDAVFVYPTEEEDFSVRLPEWVARLREEFDDGGHLELVLHERD